MSRVGCFVLVMVLPLVARAIDVQATIKRVDAESSRITFGTPDGRDRTVKVSADAKLLDADGKELAGGLKSEQLKEGTKVQLTVVPEGNQPVITSVRPGLAGRAPGLLRRKPRPKRPRQQSHCRSSILRPLWRCPICGRMTSITARPAAFILM